MYRDMDQWIEIRRRVLVEGVSKRQILRETGLHWTTLEKVLRHGEPPGYQRRKAAGKPKIDPYLERIAQILQSDQQLPRKQRHTAKVIWRELAKEGFTGAYTVLLHALNARRTLDTPYQPREF